MEVVLLEKLIEGDLVWPRVGIDDIVVSQLFNLRKDLQSAGAYFAKRERTWSLVTVNRFGGSISPANPCIVPIQ